VDVVYECTLCGSCDVSCKVCRYDMHPLSGAKEFRYYLNQKGVVPPAYPGVIAKLRDTGNMAGARSPTGRLDGRTGPQEAGRPRGAGDRRHRRQSRRPVPRRVPLLFQPGAAQRGAGLCRVLAKGGLDFAIDSDERCCGGKAYDMGYRDDFEAAAKANLEKWAAAGVKTVVSPCATCFWTFKRLYPKVAGDDYGLEILHTTQVADRSSKKASSSSPIRCR